MQTQARGWRWCTFRLRTLLAVFLALLAPLAIIGEKYRRIRRQRSVVAIAAAELGWIAVAGRGSFADRWLEKVFGEGTFAPYVYLETSRWTSDADLAKLRDLPDIESLYLCGENITDAGLRELSHLHRLSGLRLDQTAVSDRGLLLLRPLARLRNLWLYDSKVTGVGIRDLESVLPFLEVHRNRASGG